MAKYKLEFKPSVWKDLDPVPKADRRRILKKIDSLQDDPRPFGSKKLAAQEKYRIRQGDYRILYTIEDDVLTVHAIRVGGRREIYDR
jgi:mRNA interferase RelE/StbE